MSIRPTSVQALQDNGVGAAASLLGNNIGSLAGMLNQRAKNKNDIIEALLGQAGTGIRESLTSARESRQGREGLEAAAQIMPELANLKGKIPDDLKIDPVTTNTLINANSPYRILGMADKFGNIGKRTEESGDPSGSGLIKHGTNLAFKLIGNNGSSSGQQSGGSDLPAPETASDQVPTQETPGGTFKGGVTKSGITPTDSSQPEGSFFYQGAKADLEKKNLENRDLKVKNATSDPQYLYGVGANSLTDLIKNEGQGKSLEAVDLAGVPMGIKMSRGLASARVNYARSTPEQQSVLATSAREAAQNLDDFVRLRDDVIKYKKDGTLNRLVTSIGANGVVQYLLPDNAPEELVNTVNFLNNADALAMKMAAATQGKTGISNADVRGFRNLIGDPRKPLALFEKQTDDFLAKTFVAGLRAGAVADGDSFARSHSIYQDLVGENFDYDDPRATTKILDGMKTQRAIKSETRTVSPTLTLDGVQKPSQQAPVAQSASPSGDRDKLLLDIEGILTRKR